MLKYNHLGIPISVKRAKEAYLPRFNKMYVSGYGESPYKVEWMRFEDGCPLPEIVKTVPHVAFEVENLTEAIIRQNRHHRAQQSVTRSSGRVH